MSIEEHQAPRAVPPKCLTITCENEATTRGICPTCYATARQMIKTGATTEEELMDKGMLKAPHLSAGSLFRQQFNQL